MTCEEAIDHLVSCLYGELAGDLAEALRSHLEECPKCQEELRGLSWVRGLLESREDPAPSPLVIQRLVTEVRGKTSRAMTDWGLGWLRVAIPICFMVAVGAWITVHYHGHPGLGERMPGLSHEEVTETSAGQQVVLREAEVPGSLTVEVGQEDELSGGITTMLPEQGAGDKAEKPFASSPPVLKEKADSGVPVLTAAPPAISRERPAPSPRSEGFPSKKEGTISEVSSDLSQDRMADDQMFTASRAGRDEARGLAEQLKAERPGTYEGPSPAPAAPLRVRRPLPEKLGHAEALLEAGDYEAAEEAFLRSIAEMRPEDPKLPLALFGLAEAKERLGKVEEALDIYVRLQREFPEYGLRAAQRIQAMSHGGAANP